jgi:hypothetical protein
MRAAVPDPLRENAAARSSRVPVLGDARMWRIAIDASQMDKLFKPVAPAPKGSSIMEFLRWLTGKPVLSG